MQQRNNRRYFVLASVVLLGLMTLMIGIDAQAQIAFVSGKNRKTDIYVMDADGGNRRRFTNSPRDEWSPAWSPDGERIAFSSNSDIYVMDANGRKHRKLTNNRDGSSPFWSPDGERIAFVSSRDDWRTSDIYVMNTDGKKIQNLTNDLWRNSVPAWSPDGERIAFSSQRGNDSRDIDIYVIHINSGNIQNLTKNFHGSGWAPAWSPDGKRIAFVSAVRGDEPEIYVMNINDGIPQKITDNRWLDNNPSWSPDGKRIAFSSKRGPDWNTRNGDWDIYVMDTDGRNIQNLTNNPLAHEWSPAWYFPAFAVAPAGKQFTVWGWLKRVAR